MGHKVNPTILRIPYIQPWKSRWFSKKEYAYFLEEDIKIRNFLQKKLKEALLEKIEIERSTNKFNIIIHATRPGLIIGRGGAGIEDLKKEISTKVLKNKQKIEINIQEVKKPMACPAVLVQSMAIDIEKRIPFRKVLKQAISKALKDGAKGIKVMVSGRLNGVDIARSETLSSGKIPLHTLRADIRYARGVANTTYGVIGIKVWVYKGEIFKKK